MVEGRFGGGENQKAQTKEMSTAVALAECKKHRFRVLPEFIHLVSMCLSLFWLL